MSAATIRYNFHVIAIEPQGKLSWMQFNLTTDGPADNTGKASTCPRICIWTTSTIIEQDDA